MKAFARSLTVAAVLAAPALAAYADPVLDGQISIQGSDRATATGVDFAVAGSASAANASGSFQGLFSRLAPADLVLLQSFTYAGVNDSGRGDDILEVFSNGSSSSLVLDLTQVSETTCGSDQICVSGTGLLQESGYDETPATFNLTTQGGNAEGRFSAMISASPAPEPSSLLLLGTGLLGSAALLYRRKRIDHSS